MVSSGPAAERGCRKLDEHALAGVAAVAVLDGVDDTLADGDAHPVLGILVKADVADDVVADHLHEVQHLKGAGELEANDFVRVVGGHADAVTVRVLPVMSSGVVT